MKENMTQENSKSYGNKELIECVKHFNKFIQGDNETEQQSESMDLTNASSEWKTLKN